MTAGRLPTFLNALKAVWLLTWKSQWTLSRLPARLGTLLALPVLVFITVVPPEKWMHRQSFFFGDPDGQLDSFSRRLAREQISFDDAQKKSLRQILTEEYAQAQGSWQERPGEPATSRKERLQEYADASGARIVERARKVLNEQQMAQFESWERRARATTVSRLSVVVAPWGRTTPFYYWLIDFYFIMILPLACVRGCGPLIRDELLADTLSFLVTRPVSRARLLIVKYIAQVAWLEGVLLVETLLLFAAAAERHIPGLGSLIPLVLCVQILAVPAWCALGALLGQVTTHYMAGALIYGAIVEMGIGRIPTNINAISLMRHIETLLSRNAALEGVFNWDTGAAWVAVTALVVAPLIFVGAAALLFNFIEYHASAEMQR